MWVTLGVWLWATSTIKCIFLCNFKYAKQADSMVKKKWTISYTKIFLSSSILRVELNIYNVYMYMWVSSTHWHNNYYQSDMYKTCIHVHLHKFHGFWLSTKITKINTQWKLQNIHVHTCKVIMHTYTYMYM